MESTSKEYQVLEKREIYRTPWVTVVEKTIRFPHLPDDQNFCVFELQDFVACLAITHDGKIPIVGQYRPAVEAWTWELPSGHVENGETPEQAVVRELQEETGLIAEQVIPLPQGYPDVGRLSNVCHPFFIRAMETTPTKIEEGLECRFVTFPELKEMVRKGEFGIFLHVAMLAMAEWFVQPGLSQ